MQIIYISPLESNSESVNYNSRATFYILNITSIFTSKQEFLAQINIIMQANKCFNFPQFKGKFVIDLFCNLYFAISHLEGNEMYR